VIRGRNQSIAGEKAARLAPGQGNSQELDLVNLFCARVLKKRLKPPAPSVSY